MNHQHLPTEYILKDATKDLVKNLWTYVDKNNGTAKCAICGQMIAVPECESLKNFYSKYYIFSYILAFIISFLGYGLRWLVFWIYEYDFMDSIVGVLVGIALCTLMIVLSNWMRRIHICRYWVYNEWREVDSTVDTMVELEEDFRPYRHALSLGLHVIIMIAIFIRGYTIAL